MKNHQRNIKYKAKAETSVTFDQNERKGRFGYIELLAANLPN